MLGGVDFFFWNSVALANITYEQLNSRESSARPRSFVGRLRSNEVPEVTACRWANDAEIQKRRDQERVAACARERL